MRTISGKRLRSKKKTSPRTQFLKRYDISIEIFEGTGLAWELLDEICEHHAKMHEELQSAADYVVRRLQAVPSVHSLKSRIKNPEHLREKIIRKKSERQD